MFCVEKLNVRQWTACDIVTTILNVHTSRSFNSRCSRSSYPRVEGSLRLLASFLWVFSNRAIGITVGRALSAGSKTSTTHVLASSSLPSLAIHSSMQFRFLTCVLWKRDASPLVINPEVCSVDLPGILIGDGTVARVCAFPESEEYGI